MKLNPTIPNHLFAPSKTIILLVILFTTTLFFQQGAFAQTSYSYSEGFENSLGIWSKGGGSTAGINPVRDWRIHSGATGSPFTGPSAAAEGSDYAYYETSFTSPDLYPQEEAWLSANFDFSSTSNLALTFAYHMWADDVPPNHQFYHPDLGMGDFFVDIHDGNQWQNGVWQRNGDQGNQWHTAVLDLSAYDGLANVTIRLRGTATNYTGDMAVDDILITGVQAAEPLNYVEGFESGNGIWQNGGGNSSRDWRRNQSNTPSPFTGPSSASEGSSYNYYETSFTSPNPYPEEEAWLEADFNFEQYQNIQLTFDYHLWADQVPANHQFYHPDLGMGNFFLDVFDGSQWINGLFSLSGDQGNQWHTTTIDLSAYSGLPSVKLRFRGQATNYTSDMAVDNIVITADPIGALSSDSNSQLSAGPGASPSSISSLSSTSASTIDILDFQISDLGTTDGLPTIIQTIKFTKSSNNDVADLSAVIEAVSLQNTSTGLSYTGTIDADEVSFDNLHHSIPDLSSNDYLLSLYLSTSLPQNTDGQLLELLLLSNNITTGTTGSSLANGNSLSTGIMALEIIATDLRFTQSPSAIAVINETLTIPPIVAATDINGNTDLDFSGLISLTNSIALPTENAQMTVTQGIASFDDFYFSSSSNAVATFLTASAPSLVDISSTIGIIIQDLPPPLTYQYVESFENGLGIWTKSGGNQGNPRRDWRTHSNGTPSPFTGPDFAIDGDSYIYYEASDLTPIVYPQEEASFEAIFDFTDAENLILSFDYHMRVDEVPSDHQYYIPNATMGNLLVDIHDGNDWNLEVFSQSGDQNNTWRTAKIDLSSYSDLDHVTIRFRGQVSHYLNDMAIDNIRIKNSDDLKVVVIGSSTAAGWGPEDISDAWANRYRVYLQGINPFDELANLGDPGKSTYQLMPDGNQPALSGRPLPLENANVSAALALQPDRIIVNLPSNDALNGYGVAEQMANFSVMYNEAQSQGVEMWIMTTQPRDFGVGQQVQKTAIQTQVRDDILAIYGSDAIDVWTTLAQADGRIESIYDSGDGTHLSTEGHSIIYDRVIARGLQSSQGRSFKPMATKLAVEAISVFPNPFVDEISIRTKGLLSDADYRLSIYDLSGILLHREKLHLEPGREAWRVSLEMEDGPAVLVLEEENGGKKWYQRVIKY